VQILYEDGKITEYERQKHIHKHIVFPVLGSNTHLPRPDVRKLEDNLVSGDIFLLCTDGLSDFVAKSEIEECLGMPKSLEERTELLYKMALEKESKDNISIITMLYMGQVGE
jgi:protein phosphatase